MIMSGLLETLRGAITPEITAQVADLFGESPDAAASGLGAILPTLLGALAIRTGHEGIADVMRMTEIGLDGDNPLDDLGATLSGPAARGALMEHGASIATELLGGQFAPVAAAISGQSGLRSDTVASLIRLGAPLAMGAIARVLGNQPTAQGITDLLEAEGPAITAALPPGLRELLTPLAAAQTPLHGTLLASTAGAAASAGRWLPWLLGSMLVFGIFVGLRGCQERGDDRAAMPGPTTVIVTEAPREVMEVVLPDDTRLKLESGHVGFELVRFLQSADPAPRSFRFEDIVVQGGSDTLDESSAAAVRTVATIMRAFPTMTARIIDHTDSQGDAATNQALSERRARAVETLIEASGIADERIDSEGRGQTEPIATNETAEGRAQNRRTVILVLTR
ncbi:MAG: OmpA family protein [Sandarakinorhabdus sp.]|nr:OmpA family protein [Sandarakinorhabdus sp.]MBS3960900.1 OmpA family protein [Sandarakinorhabdus sp.]